MGRGVQGRSDRVGSAERGKRGCQGKQASVIEEQGQGNDGHGSRNREASCTTMEREESLVVT